MGGLKMSFEPLCLLLLKNLEGVNLLNRQINHYIFNLKGVVVLISGNPSRPLVVELSFVKQEVMGSNPIRSRSCEMFNI